MRMCGGGWSKAWGKAAVTNSAFWSRIIQTIRCSNAKLPCQRNANNLQHPGGDPKRDFPFSHRSKSTLQKEVAKTHKGARLQPDSMGLEARSLPPKGNLQVSKILLFVTMVHVCMLVIGQPECQVLCSAIMQADAVYGVVICEGHVQRLLCRLKPADRTTIIHLGDNLDQPHS